MKKGGIYTLAEMSLVMRNQCLQGKVKTNSQKYIDFKKLEQKLDDKFLDEEKAVDIITKQLSDLSSVKWEHCLGIVKLVDMVEEAAMDLKVVGNVAIMKNPVIVCLAENARIR
jgi:hypothetical protein